jgi:signal transduction histidine kinase
MKRQLRRFQLIKAVVLTILFCTAVYFENAQQQRLLVLVAVFVLYLALGFARSFIQADGTGYFISFFADIALVYILEFNSRLLINYFLHSFYIIILLEAALTLGLRRGAVIGAFAVIISLIKYIYLIYYKFNFSNVSQLAFFLMVNTLILVIAGFAQHNKEERERKEMLYRELLDTHKELKQSTDEVNRLTIVEERNRIARDIHDTLGHNMTALIMQLQMAEHLIREDIPKAERLLVDAVKTAKDSLSGIREVVETLRGDSSTAAPAEALRKLVSEFAARTGTDISLELSGEANIRDTVVNAAVYHILQEAMTNAVRHGKAGRIWVRLDFTGAAVEFNVRDNGSGAEKLKEGYGLKGIRERVKAFGGNVEYGTGEGFYIKGILYLEGRV